MHVMAVSYGEPRKCCLNFILGNLWATQPIVLLIWPPLHLLTEFANSALWFVPEAAQSTWTLQETHRDSTNYVRDEARTSERLLDRQAP